MSFFLRKKRADDTGINAGMIGFYDAPDPRLPRRNYGIPPDPEQLTKDLNVAHVNIRKLVKENDRLRRSIDFLRLWTKILSGAVLASWAVILTLLARILR